MTNDRRQQDFAQRLSRISKERGVDVDPRAGEPTGVTSDYDYNAPQKKHPIRNGIIWIVVLAAAGVGGFYGWNAMPQDLKDMLASVVSSEDPTARAPEDIPETDTMSDQGVTLASPAVLHTGTEPLALTDVVMQVSLPTIDTATGNIIPVVRNPQCTLRSPTQGETVMGVRIENALLPAPVHVFSNAQLTDTTLQNIKTVTQNGADPLDDMALSGEKTVLDVFVTDTSAPLYLVLQNIGPGIVWTLHAAPQVEIAHVALIGSDFSGVANLPNDATVEALLVSDFLPPHQYGADDVARDCMIRPWRTPQPDWIGSRKSEAGSLSYQNQMSSYAKGFAAYNSWYTATLGVDAAANTVTARDAAHVLLGPRPDAPFGYAPLAGQDIHMVATDHLMTGDFATRSTAITQLQQALLGAAIGGDISALNPPAMERNSQ
ncbi:hypothetical protein BC777_3187 [Yoonia maricola]|uniref:Uncharacterized protein n=1 Tax=Yoonia maricola TaxID=420999 RepID=A0A2M8W2R2_9RHOB|nr:hypothetical protein [Yoonia maricola]PJI85188.1 hypothetical protein BC777_3187 [Yoonia maricola]